MKKYIPLIIIAILFGIASFFYIDELIVLFNQSSQDFIVAFILFSVAGLVLLVTSFIYITGSLRRSNNKLKERLDAWASLSMYVRQAGDEVFTELPIGILIYDEQFEVKWNNKETNQIFNSNDILDLSLSELSKSLFELVSLGKNKGVIIIDEKHFDIIIRNESRIIYIFDETQRELAKIEYLNKIPVMGLLSFDNLEESFVNLDVSDQSRIRGAFLAAIDDWLTKYDGYLKMINDDTLMFFTHKSKLDEMILNKFEILEEIRKISLDNQIRVTLSIGIASYDANFDSLGIYAQSAIDLAEKRGGDQVVVNIEGEKIQYFGARLDASEKASRVSARINAQTLREYINKASQIFTIGHNIGDLDSFGSMIAISQMAKIDNKKAFVVYDTEKLDMTVNKILKDIDFDDEFFDNHITSETAINKIDDNSLLIVVDTQTPKIIMSNELLAAAKNVIVIDHHRISDETFEALFTYIEPSASSTIELLVELMGFYNDKTFKFTNLEANLMYGGLVLDTQNFTTRTGVRTFDVAYKLREYGASPAVVKTWLRKDMNRTLRINKLLASSELYLERFLILKSDEQQPDRILLAQASDEALAIDGIDAAFTIAPVGDDIAVSSRSISDTNVQLVMEHIGGGGHLNSAAAQIKNSDIESVIKDIKEFLNMEYGIEGEEMKVILLEDVKGRGLKDDVIDVAPGYANFLVKNGKALVASEENLQSLEAKQAEIAQKELDTLNLMKQLKADIESKSVTISIEVGESGKMFGSVTNKIIAEEYENQNGISLDRRKIELKSDINSVGIYQATITLHKQVKANIEINVVEKE